MSNSGFLFFFLLGIAGGTHCIGMCGGIVSALSMGQQSRLNLHLAYNAGRIASYTLAGFLVGAIGAGSQALSGQLPFRLTLMIFANLMLIAMGFYLLGITSLLAPAERAGHRIWRWIQPLGKNLLPVHSVFQAFPLGLLWGWLPCGLVYSVLASALKSSSAWEGGGLMLAFGLGTLPTLLLSGLFVTGFRKWMQHPWVRSILGIAVLAYGGYGLYQIRHFF